MSRFIIYFFLLCALVAWPFILVAIHRLISWLFV